MRHWCSKSYFGPNFPLGNNAFDSLVSPLRLRILPTDNDATQLFVHQSLAGSVAIWLAMVVCSLERTLDNTIHVLTSLHVAVNDVAGQHSNQSRNIAENEVHIESCIRVGHVTLEGVHKYRRCPFNMSSLGVLCFLTNHIHIQYISDLKHKDFVQKRFIEQVQTHTRQKKCASTNSKPYLCQRK